MLRSSLLFCSALTTTSFAGGPTITPLTYLTVGNSIVVDQAHVSDDGAWVVAVTDSPNGLSRLHWQRTAVWTQYDLPAIHSLLSPTCISEDVTGNEVCVGYSGMLKFSNLVAIAVPAQPGGIWHGGVGFNALSNDTSVTGLSADGLIAVGDILDPNTLEAHGTSWSVGAVIDLLTSESSFTAISADGSSVFGIFSEIGGNRFTAIKRAGGMNTMLTPLDVNPTFIADCNSDGNIAVGQRFGNTMATDATPLRFDGVVQQLLPTNPAQYDDYWVHSVTDAGDLIVGQGRVQGSGDDEAVVWHNTFQLMTLQAFMTSEGLDLSGWTLWRATDISPDGRFIVGSGQFAGENVAFLIERPTPVGLSRCSGDGGNQMGCTDCPCGNNAPAGTTGGCLNSSGNSTELAASGSPSVSLPSGDTSDLRLSLRDAPASAFCVMLSGSNLAPQNMANPCFGLGTGANAIDRDGLRCAVGSLLRHGGRSADVAGSVADSSGPSRVWGGEAGPPAGLAVQAGFVAGQTRYFQVTHREDPMAVCMRGLNTSQALEVSFLP